MMLPGISRTMPYLFDLRLFGRQRGASLLTDAMTGLFLQTASHRIRSILLRCPDSDGAYPTKSEPRLVFEA